MVGCRLGPSERAAPGLQCRCRAIVAFRGCQWRQCRAVGYCFRERKHGPYISSEGWAVDHSGIPTVNTSCIGLPLSAGCLCPDSGDSPTLRLLRVHCLSVSRSVSRCSRNPQPPRKRQGTHARGTVDFWIPKRQVLRCGRLPVPLRRAPGGRSTVAHWPVLRPTRSLLRLVLSRDC